MLICSYFEMVKYVQFLKILLNKCLFFHRQIIALLVTFGIWVSKRAIFNFKYQNQQKIIFVEKKSVNRSQHLFYDVSFLF